WIPSCALPCLKQKLSRAGEKTAILGVATSSRAAWGAGGWEKRKNGGGAPPMASLMALKPFSISSIALPPADGSGKALRTTRFGQDFSLARFACDHVWPPMV